MRKSDHVLEASTYNPYSNAPIGSWYVLQDEGS